MYLNLLAYCAILLFASISTTTCIQVMIPSNHFHYKGFLFSFFSFDSIRMICLFLAHSINLTDTIVFKLNFCNWTFILRLPVILFSFQYFCKIFFNIFFHQRAVTHLENVCQLNIRRGKKPGFQLSLRQPLKFVLFLTSMSVCSNLILTLTFSGNVFYYSFFM